MFNLIVSHSATQNDIRFSQGYNSFYEYTCTNSYSVFYKQYETKLLSCGYSQEFIKYFIDKKLLVKDGYTYDSSYSFNEDKYNLAIVLAAEGVSKNYRTSVLLDLPVNNI